MKKFGLIGHPIAHSLSPALFKAGYDCRYPYELIETPDFEDAYKRFLAGYDGINVTAPFKELAFRKADILSDECRAVKATNLLIKTPEGIKAYNSDYLGVRMWLEADVLSANEKRAIHLAAGVGGVLFVGDTHRPMKTLIVGLGGAGKAAAAASRSLGMETVLMNRTVYNDTIKPLTEFRKEFRKADIVIYTIPTPIPQLDDLDENDFNPDRPKHILEANYKDPAFGNTFMERMNVTDTMVRYSGGRTWLLYQALTGYEIFTGEIPDLEKMSACL